ncbi:MAG TPA: ABC transporter ATP-binding protein [Methylomirabilota bacterium]|nr:ABC transporter ATP-binding protein [Methylomirabilota bacterium]
MRGADVVDVRVEDLRKRYGPVEALRGVSLAFAAGRLTAILGPSGCGKTTLLRSIAGFVRVDAGSIRFGGEDVTARPPQERATAMVFQSYALWPHMTVFDNVAYGLRLRRLPRDEIRARVVASLALVAIGDVEAVALRKPGALSGGQQQRVALARALVIEPRVLLLDEPLSNLDAKVRQRLRAEIRRLQRRVGITTIYVTHDQEEALAIADQVVLMNAGAVVQAGAPEEVYCRPADAFAADFLGVTTRLSGRVVAGRLEIGGQSLPYAGAVHGPVEVVLRASDLKLAPSGAPADTPALAGRVEESLFLGTHYRHYVRVGNVLVMIDGADPVPEGPISVIIPADALRVFEVPRA